MSDYNIFRTEIVPGTLEQFRGFMYMQATLQAARDNDRLYLQGEISPSGAPRAWARWEFIRGGSKQQRGYILALELPEEQTRLRFAYHAYKFDPIGPEFEMYVDEVIRELKGQGAADVAQAESVPGDEATGDQPWEKIPDYSYDRQLLELWHSGYSGEEIGNRLSRVPRRIYNRLAELRKLYGEEVVPRRRPSAPIK